MEQYTLPRWLTVRYLDIVNIYRWHCTRVLYFFHVSGFVSDEHDTNVLYWHVTCRSVFGEPSANHVNNDETFCFTNTMIFSRTFHFTAQ